MVKQDIMDHQSIYQTADLQIKFIYFLGGRSRISQVGVSTPRVEIQIYNYGHFFPEKLYEVEKKGPRRGASLASIRFATIDVWKGTVLNFGFESDNFGGNVGANGVLTLMIRFATTRSLNPPLFVIDQCTKSGIIWKSIYHIECIKEGLKYSQNVKGKIPWSLLIFDVNSILIFPGSASHFCVRLIMIGCSGITWYKNVPGCTVVAIISENNTGETCPRLPRCSRFVQPCLAFNT